MNPSVDGNMDPLGVAAAKSWTPRAERHNIPP
jgi:hypothetical protein